MPVDIVDNLNLASDIPLDVRYRANTYMDVSAYWYEGMQVYQYTDKKIWFYNGTVWAALDQSGGGTVTLGSNLHYDASNNVAVVDSPIFDGSLHIKDELFIDKNIHLADYELTSPTEGDLWWEAPRLLFDDGTDFRDVLQGSLRGVAYPANPEEGDLFYRSDIGMLFVYDGTRNKYLSVGRSTIVSGRTTAVAGSTVYLRVGDATQSSATGYRMMRNGTITGFSVENSNTLTSPRSIQILLNDVSTLTRVIASGNNGFHYSNENVDFSAGDVLQVSTLPGAVGSALNNWIVMIEFTYRA